MPKGRSQTGKHRSKPDPLARAVGQRIRKLRIEKDFTFDAFVEETGLGRGYISELERGLVVPTIHTLAKIATALEVTNADLVLGDSIREEIFELLRGMSEPELRKLQQQVRALVAPAPE